MLVSLVLSALIKILVLQTKRESYYLKYNYGYDVDGNQTSKSDNKGNVTSYSYDGLGRLKTESENSKSRGLTTKSYNYDYSGNRSSMTVSGTENYTTEYSYYDDNRLEKERKTYTNGNITTLDYTYDGNGNQRKKMESQSKSKVSGPIKIGIALPEELETTYEERKYDLFNQLTNVSDGKMNASYTYMPDGLRMSKNVNGEYTGFIWHGSQILEITDGNGNMMDRYKYGVERIGDSSGNSYIYNAHGDVTGLVNSSGMVYKEYEYDAFGVEVNKDDNDTNYFRYCGEYFDKETDSIYLRARYYSPMNGRFTTEDPARDGGNWYAYCNGNPVMAIDLTGLFSQPAELYLEKYRNDYIEAFNAGDSEGVKRAEQNLKKVGELDEQGLITGTVYKFTGVSQVIDGESIAVCWAAVDVCYTLNIAGIELSEEDASYLAVALAVVSGSVKEDFPGEWDESYVPNLYKDKKNPIVQFHNVAEIIDGLKEYGPLAAQYANSDNKRGGHSILLTGAASAPGLEDIVSTMNPNGKENMNLVQSYEDFQNGNKIYDRGKLDSVDAMAPNQLVLDIYNGMYGDYKKIAKNALDSR